MNRSIQFPLSQSVVQTLHAGDVVLLNGSLFTARDAAHKRLCELLDQNQALPIDLTNETLYFVGPSPAKPGAVIGAAGPTTSGRMDSYSNQLMAQTGLRGMIGKGPRSEKTKKAMQDFQCVYFAAVGGAGALLSKCIIQCQLVCYPDLGSEAIYRIEVKDFPAIVAIDIYGNDLYHPSEENLMINPELKSS